AQNRAIRSGSAQSKTTWTCVAIGSLLGLVRVGDGPRIRASAGGPRGGGETTRTMLGGRARADDRDPRGASRGRLRGGGPRGPPALDRGGADRFRLAVERLSAGRGRPDRPP